MCVDIESIANLYTHGEIIIYTDVIRTIHISGNEHRQLPSNSSPNIERHTVIRM